MHSSILWISILGAVACATDTNAAERRTTIPAQFHGEWNMTKKDCGTSRNDSVLRISAKEVRHFESRGKVYAVVTRGRHDLAVITEASGEGETWLSAQHYRLSPDRKELTDEGSQPPLIRYRCP